MSESPPTLKQIQAEFERARQKLALLQQDVRKAARLADFKSQSDRLDDEREQASLGLGQAVWVLVKRGELRLPPSCAPQVAALEAVEVREKALAADISVVLQEGSEAADRLKRGPGKK